MNGIRIRAAEGGDEEALAEMMTLLWPDGGCKEHRDEAAALIATGMCGTLPGAFLMAEDGEGRALGFLQVGLRSHADGCDVMQAVGFIEGWFVYPEAQRQGVGKRLMEAAEDWARAKGCVEVASDALAENSDSERAHCALGFEVVDRCVHFRKKL